MEEKGKLKSVILLFKMGVHQDRISEMEADLLDGEELKECNYIPAFKAKLYESTIERLRKKYEDILIEESVECTIVDN